MNDPYDESAGVHCCSQYPGLQCVSAHAGVQHMDLWSGLRLFLGPSFHVFHIIFILNRQTIDLGTNSSDERCLFCSGQYQLCRLAGWYSLTWDGSAKIDLRPFSLCDSLSILESWRGSVSRVRSVAREILLAEDESIYGILVNDVHVIFSW